MRRVLLIGPGGAGKSTLARQLAERTGLPLVHLDALYWRPGWRESPKDEWRATVAALVERETWIIDGNYGGTLDARLAACDTVVFLDLAPWRCAWRVLARRVQFHGRPRPEMPDGCNEQLDAGFLGWVLSYRRLRRPGILQRLDAARAEGKQVRILRTPAAVAAWLDSLPPEGASATRDA